MTAVTPALVLRKSISSASWPALARDLRQRLGPMAFLEPFKGCNIRLLVAVEA